MLTNNKNLKGLVIRATDGEIGTVDQLYFDDQIWAIRYLTAETGNWLDGQKSSSRHSRSFKRTGRPTGSMYL